MKSNLTFEAVLDYGNLEEKVATCRKALEQVGTMPTAGIVNPYRIAKQRRIQVGNPRNALDGFLLEKSGLFVGDIAVLLLLRHIAEVGSSFFIQIEAQGSTDPRLDQLIEIVSAYCVEDPKLPKATECYRTLAKRLSESKSNSISERADFNSEPATLKDLLSRIAHLTDRQETHFFSGCMLDLVDEGVTKPRVSAFLSLASQMYSSLGDEAVKTYYQRHFAKLLDTVLV